MIKNACDFELTRNDVQAIVCDSNEKKIVGIALFYLTFSTWKGKMMYLEDLVVQESMRRHGIGKMLVLYFCLNYFFKQKDS